MQEAFVPRARVSVQVFDGHRFVDASMFGVASGAEDIVELMERSWMG